MIPMGTYMKSSDGIYHFQIMKHIIMDKFRFKGREYECLVWDRELDRVRIMCFHEQSMMNDKKMTKNEVQKFEERLGKEDE